MRKTGNMTAYRENLRLKILDTAMSLFKKRGIKAVRMDDIATDMGISKRTLYEIYSKKEDLLFECVKRENETLTKKIADYAIGAENEMAVVAYFIKLRLKDLGKNEDMMYSLYFKNFGPEAGASLYHSHSQIITTPFIPVQMYEEISGALEYHNENGRCVYCDIIKEEKALNERVICENKNFIAISPFASRSPYQIYIIPKEHSDSIIHVSSSNILDFASILKDVFDRLYKLLGEVSFNYVLHTLLPTLENKYKNSSHWFLDIMPKMSKLAGYELGSGVFINSITPEDATNDLKNAL